MQHPAFMQPPSEDIDQLFSIICSLVTSKGSFETPDEILQHIVRQLRSRFIQRGEELVGESMRGVRDFQAWLAPLGMHLHNAFANRGGVESPHSFSFKLRRDAGAELQVWGDDRQGSAGSAGSVRSDCAGDDPEDVLCCVKTYMRDTTLQQPPVVALPASRRGWVVEKEPTQVVRVRPLTAGEVESYVLLADICENELGLTQAREHCSTWCTSGSTLCLGLVGWGRVEHRALTCPTTATHISLTCQKYPSY
jgi:hypothetical protein